MALTKQRCVPCHGGEPTATDAEIAAYLRQVPDWQIVVREGVKQIERMFRFKDFVGSIDFVNRVKNVAEAEGHHPDLHISWNRVRVVNYTHAIGGLHQNDFILAAKIDELA